MVQIGRPLAVLPLGDILAVVVRRIWHRAKLYKLRADILGQSSRQTRKLRPAGTQHLPLNSSNKSSTRNPVG